MHWMSTIILGTFRNNWEATIGPREIKGIADPVDTCLCLYVLGRSRNSGGQDMRNLTKPTSEPRSGSYSERFDIYIACFRKLAPTDAEKREKLEPEKQHANRGRIFSVSKESIFGIVKCVATSGTSKIQIVMAAQLIRDRVEMECLEGAWETLEGNTRCRFRGTIRFTATSLVHPDEPARTLQRTVEWILPTPTPYRLVEPVQVIEVTSSEEDPEEDLEELPPEPAGDALDFLEGDEDPLLEVDSPEEVMSASEADSTEGSGPREMAISGGSSS
ncbi:hypothetical protein GmHk_06G017403 [Glycine max]|nr:hypothetical protein GmHk_06G017403 [Glycine max]